MRFGLIKARQSIDLIEVHNAHQPHQPTNNKKMKKTTANERSANSTRRRLCVYALLGGGGGTGNRKRVAHGDRGRFFCSNDTQEERISQVKYCLTAYCLGGTPSIAGAYRDYRWHCHFCFSTCNLLSTNSLHVMSCGHFTLRHTCGLLRCTATSKPAASSQQQPAAVQQPQRAAARRARSRRRRWPGATAQRRSP